MGKFLVQIKKDGIIAFSIRVLKFILRRSIGLDWRSEIIAERSLEEPIQEIEPRIEVTIRIATEDDLDKFKGIVNERKFELFEERFKKGRVCFVALFQGKIVYFGWISFENEYESNCQIKVELNGKGAYWFDCYTAPKYRQNKLHTALTTKALIYLKNKGYKKVLILVYNNNIFSRKAFSKVGFKGKKIVTLIKLFGLKFYIWREFKREL